MSRLASKSKFSGAFCSFLVFVFFGFPAIAETLATYSIEPMQAVLKLEDQSTRAFVIVNHSQESVTVTLEAFERIDKNGSELRLKTKDLVFDRTRLEIAPGQSANVNVEYKGKKNIAVERSFRVVTKQLSSASPHGGVRFSYETSLFVARDKMVSDVRAELRSKPVDGGFVVELHNRGTAHQALSDVTFFVLSPKDSSEATNKVLPGEIALELDRATKEMLGKQVLLPRSKRRLKLRLEAQEAIISPASLIVVRRVP